VLIFKDIYRLLNFVEILILLFVGIVLVLIFKSTTKKTNNKNTSNQQSLKNGTKNQEIGAFLHFGHFLVAPSRYSGTLGAICLSSLIHF
jgi:hypothetical protein